jgi:hypothetical protein
MSKFNALEDGEYYITNVGHKNTVILPDENFNTPLAAHHGRELPEAKVYTPQRSSFTLIPKQV